MKGGDVRASKTSKGLTSKQLETRKRRRYLKLSKRTEGGYEVTKNESNW